MCQVQPPLGLHGAEQGPRIWGETELHTLSLPLTSFCCLRGQVDQIKGKFAHIRPYLRLGFNPLSGKLKWLQRTSKNSRILMKKPVQYNMHRSANVMLDILSTLEIYTEASNGEVPLSSPRSAAVPKKREGYRAELRHVPLGTKRITGSRLVTMPDPQQTVEANLADFSPGWRCLTVSKAGVADISSSANPPEG